MSRPIEVSLRIPQNRKQPLMQDGYPVDMAGVRFRRGLEVPAIPKPGDEMTLAASGLSIQARVVQANWDEGKSLFVVSCQYANRTIPVEEQTALVNDPEWRLEPLI
jgi:hypothetical protein